MRKKSILLQGAMRYKTLGSVTFKRAPFHQLAISVRMETDWQVTLNMESHTELCSQTNTTAF